MAMFERSEPAPASVYAMHTLTVPATAAGTKPSHWASVPNARTVGATSAAAVSMSGASWYAASKLSTACQLRGRPPPPYSVGRLTPSSPAVAGPAQHRPLELRVPAGQVGGSR